MQDALYLRAGIIWYTRKTEVCGKPIMYDTYVVHKLSLKLDKGMLTVRP